MEKILANFLKGLGLTPEFLQEKMQEYFAVVDDFNNRLSRVEQRQLRVEAMLVRLCKKQKIDLSEIYEPLDLGEASGDVPQVTHEPPNQERAENG